MRRLAVFVAAALLAGCASAPMTETPPGGEDCDVTVVFGSMGAGIDTFSLYQLHTWLGGRPDMVAKVTETSWGKEGERTLCVTTRTPKAANRLIMGARDLLNRLSPKAPITLANRNGQTVLITPSRVKGRGYGAVGGPPRGNGGTRSPSSPPN